MKEENEFKPPADEVQQRVIIVDGVKTTVCQNRFEIIVKDDSTVYEQQAVSALRQWIKARRG